MMTGMPSHTSCVGGWYDVQKFGNKNTFLTMQRMADTLDHCQFLSRRQGFKIKIMKISCLQGPVNHVRSLLDHSRWIAKALISLESFGKYQ
jgi:hypothetical protein